MSQQNCKFCGSANISILPDGTVACFHCNNHTKPEKLEGFMKCPYCGEMSMVIEVGENPSAVCAKCGKEKDISEFLTTVMQVDVSKSKVSDEITIKDSGKRYVNENGGQRDTDEGKFDPAYIPDRLVIKYAVNRDYLDLYFKCKDIRTSLYSSAEEFKTRLNGILDDCFGFTQYEQLQNFSIFLEVASKKYSFNNYQKLTSDEDFYRFRRSLLRHAFKCVMGLTDEPHHEAIIFNAVCLLDNFEGRKDLILGLNEPSKYSLVGTTDIGVKENKIQ